MSYNRRYDMLNQKELKELFDYNEETGVFTYKDTNITADVADVNYNYICINGKKYYSHRLAYLYVYGKHPSNCIDHINHDKRDNRIVNLRDVTYSENLRNSSISKRNTSGFVGVHYVKKNKKYKAYIHVNGRDKCLGHFLTYGEAVAARITANATYGYNENHGKTFKELK